MVMKLERAAVEIAGNHAGEDGFGAALGHAGYLERWLVFSVGFLDPRFDRSSAPMFAAFIVNDGVKLATNAAPSLALMVST
jgi:hypothetical protein